MDNTKTTSDGELERRYQHQFEASRSAEKRAIQLLDFIPYPMVEANVVVDDENFAKKLK